MYACDVALTLAGQPAAYWDGDRDAVREANPVWWYFLNLGPAPFLAAALSWALAFTAILILWRHSWTRVMAFLLTLGHAIGAGTWLWPHGLAGKVAAVALLLVAERLLSWSWRDST